MSKNTHPTHSDRCPPSLLISSAPNYIISSLIIAERNLVPSESETMFQQSLLILVLVGLATCAPTELPNGLKEKALDLALIAERNAQNAIKESQPTIEAIKSDIEAKIIELKSQPDAAAYLRAIASSPAFKAVEETMKTITFEAEPIVNGFKTKVIDPIVNSVDEKRREVRENMLIDHEIRQRLASLELVRNLIRKFDEEKKPEKNDKAFDFALSLEEKIAKTLEGHKSAISARFEQVKGNPEVAKHLKTIATNPIFQSLQKKFNELDKPRRELMNKWLANKANGEVADRLS